MGTCPNCLDPSTVGQNLLGLSYPGGNNPRTYAGDYSYSYVPLLLSEYPAIGHVSSPELARQKNQVTGRRKRKKPETVFRLNPKNRLSLQCLRPEII